MKDKIGINKDYFSRLFVLCKIHKVNMLSFSLSIIHFADFDVTVDPFKNEVKSLIDLFNQITGLYIREDNSFGTFNDAYWCGNVYYYLYKKTNKPISYLLLKLPFNELIEYYDIYHEMDMSEIYERFLEIEQEATILQLLCKYHQCTLVSLNKETGISVNTLKKYNKEDKYFYSGSFQNLYLLYLFFKVNISLFYPNNR